MSRLFLFTTFIIIIQLYQSLIVESTNDNNDDIWQSYNDQDSNVNRQNQLSNDDSSVKSSSSSSKCPDGCQCDRYTAQCKHLLLRAVPTNIPYPIENLNLLGNRINVIKKYDFYGYTELRKLFLANNRITTVRLGAFDRLTKLKKLKLNRNLIESLPDGIFAKLKNIKELDLRGNQLKCISAGFFKGLKNLRVLYLNLNKIFWISNVVRRFRHLKHFYLSFNQFKCNCQLAWLNAYVRREPDIIKPNPNDVICTTPQRLSNMPMSSLSFYEFQCEPTNNPIDANAQDVCQKDQQRCPSFCECSSEGIAKCVGKYLKSIPQNLPKNIVELNLRMNSITKLRKGDFKRYPFLKKIILSHNVITDIEPDTFVGLHFLNTLFLNSNKLTTFKPRTFNGIFNLMFLYLHNNNLECLPTYSFSELHNLYLLHLSENKLKTVNEKTFKPLNKLTYLYLVNNPLHCDCRIYWLKKYKEMLCFSPVHFRNQYLAKITWSEMDCPAIDKNTMLAIDKCTSKIKCPPGCHCTTLATNCSGLGLKDIPEDILTSTETLILSNNHIKKINKLSRLIQLFNLKQLDLSNNSLEYLDPDVFIKNRKLTNLSLQNNQFRCINNQTFREMKMLEYIDLSFNKIRCIVQGAFSNLNNLETIYLTNNKLRCNCHLSWLSTWLRQHYTQLYHHKQASDQPICHSPSPLLNGTAIINIDESHFKCNKYGRLLNTELQTLSPICNTNNDDRFCCSIVNNDCKNTRIKCPAKCKCEGAKVDCSDNKLITIPSDIPGDTIRLFLSNNQIKHLNQSMFDKMKTLKTLDIRSNRIMELTKNVFSSVKDLESLDLSFNKLQCIHSDAFKGLHKLKVLMLHNNGISSIPYGTFRDLRSLNMLALGQNEFHCDCNIKWLNQFFINRFLDNGMALCKTPKRMYLKSIYHSKPTEFLCNEETTNDAALLMSKCDACARHPCRHNGKCFPLSHHLYRCECQYPYHGKRCEQRINACFGGPCKNGGFCKHVDNYGNYECVCAKGYTGEKCTINIDDCVNHTCQNGAQCIDGISNYTCKCNHGYKGDKCEKRFTYCHDVNPCQNGAKCVLLPNNNYKCTCNLGFLGNHCEINIDDCVNNKCENGAKCFDLANSYRCQCRPGYQGNYCKLSAWQPPPLISTNVRDKKKTDRKVYIRHIGTQSLRYTNKTSQWQHGTNGKSADTPPNESACAYHNCLNGGFCLSNPNNFKKSICRCKSGYSGKTCQYLDSLSFKKMSYIEIPLKSHQKLHQFYSKTKQINISLNFITNSTSGIVLYQVLNNQKYLIVNIFKGHLRIGFNLGEKLLGPEGYSLAKVNDSVVHFMTLIIQGGHLTMYLDNKIQCTLRDRYQKNGNQDQLLKSSMYIGGAPSSVIRQAVQKYHIDTSTDFVGCVSHLRFGGELKQVNFLDYLKNGASIKPGCSILDDVVNKQQIKKTTVTKKPVKDNVISKTPAGPVKTNLDNPCKDPTRQLCKNNGLCMYRPKSKSKRKFRCQCPVGFAGRTCAKRASECRRHQNRNFIIDKETKCISSRRIKYPYCSGNCRARRRRSLHYNSYYMQPYYKNSQKSKKKKTDKCCKPVKYRSVRILFKCTSGREYYRMVHLTKRCECIKTCMKNRKARRSERRKQRRRRRHQRRLQKNQ